MGTKWIKLDKGPMAASWRYVRSVNGFTYWRSPNGKLVCKDSATGQWYRLVTTK